MVVPLKLAGILMKYMQLQRAQMSSCQSRTDKTAGVLCSSGCFKEDQPILQPPPSFCNAAVALLLGHVKRGRSVPQRNLGKQLTLAFCAKNLLEQSMHVHVWSR